MIVRLSEMCLNESQKSQLQKRYYEHGAAHNKGQRGRDKWQVLCLFSLCSLGIKQGAARYAPNGEK